jgi:WD40 repeat protein
MSIMGIFIIVIIFILFGCYPTQSVSTTVSKLKTIPSTSIPTSTLTLTPTSTQIPSPTSTPDLNLSTGDISRITEIARLGKGVLGTAIWSPDGNTILVPYTTGIYRFDAKTLEELTPVEETIAASYIALSPDGSILASTIGRWDDAIILWSTSNGAKLKSLNLNSMWGGIKQIQFSPNTMILAALAYDNTIYVWNIVDGELLQTINIIKDFVCFTFSPDGKYLVVGSNKGLIYYFDEPGGNLEKTPPPGLVSYNKDVHIMKFSPDGSILAMASYGQISFWNTKNGKLLRNGPPEREGIASIDFSPDGKFIVTLLYNGEVSVSNVQDGKNIFDTKLDNSHVSYYSFYGLGDFGWSKGVTFSPDGMNILEEAGDDLIRIRKMADWSVSGTLNDYSYPASSILFSKSGESLHILELRKLEEWRLNDGTIINQNDIPSGCSGDLMSSSSNGLVVVGILFVNYKTLLCVWMPYTNSIKKIEIGGNYRVEKLAISPNGRFAATARYPDDSTKLWDLISGGGIRGFSKLIDPDFSPDSASIALDAGRENNAFGGFYNPYTIKIFSLPDGKQTCLINLDKEGLNDEVNQKTFSPDGSILAVKTSNVIHLWKIPEGTLISEWEIGKQRIYYKYYISSLAFSNDGKILAVGDNKGVISLWRISDQKLLIYLSRHTMQVKKLLFSPDGKYLASTSEDGTVRIWGIN